MLANRVSFACNNIHLIYPLTIWRPTHYVRSEDTNLIEEQTWMPSVKFHLEFGIPCYLSAHFRGVAGEYPNYREIKHCHHYKRTFMASHSLEWVERELAKGQNAELDNEHALLLRQQEWPDEWHLPQVCQFGGSGVVAMQLALALGYDELVLVGFDLGYKDGNGRSHFDKRYEHGHEYPARYVNRNQLWAHLCGINYHARRGLPYRVINATVGGDLHLYPRARLEDLV